MLNFLTTPRSNSLFLHYHFYIYQNIQHKEYIVFSLSRKIQNTILFGGSAVQTCQWRLKKCFILNIFKYYGVYVSRVTVPDFIMTETETLSTDCLIYNWNIYQNNFRV